jgi:hypothetical protein
MPTFLKRYQAGDYAGVWADLEALGDAVRKKRYLADAQAVANETMKRVRHNAEVVVARLESLGYQFESHADTVGDMLERMQQSMEQRTGMWNSRGKIARPPIPISPSFRRRWSRFGGRMRH